MTLVAIRAEHLPALLPIWNRTEVLAALAPTMAQLTEGALAELLTATRTGTLQSAWAIIDRERIVGSIALKNMNPVTRIGELTSWAVTPGVGWMVGLKAARDALAIGFNDYNLNRIESYVHADVVASHACCKRMKANVDGILRKAAFKGGKYMDITIYSLLREEWNG